MAADHNRCEATSRATKRRCARPKCKDDPWYCVWHRRIFRMKSERGKLGNLKKYDHQKRMSKFYRKVLTKTMAEVMEEHLGIAEAEQVKLCEELSIARQMASEAIAMFGIVQGLDEKTKMEMLPGTQAVMKDALLFVERMARSAHAVMDSGKDKLSYENLRAVSNQFVRAAYDAFGENDERVKDFERNIAQIVIPVGIEGTTLTPDMDVMEMDDTVPRESDLGRCEKCGEPVAYEGDTLCPSCESSDPRFVG